MAGSPSLKPGELSAVKLPPGSQASVPDVYRLVAELPINTIITTNYDHLIERAFASVGKRVEVALTAWDIQKPSTHSAEALLVKLFGDVSTPDLLAPMNSPEREESWRTLLVRCTQLFDHDTELFLGFGNRDRQQLADLLGVLDSHHTRKTRILLTTERQKRSSSLNINKTIQLSQDGLKALLRELAHTTALRADRSSVLQSSILTRIRQYLRVLATDLRYSWTIDETKRVVTHEVPFRFETLDLENIRKSLPGATQDPVMAVSSSSSAITTFTDLLSRRRHIFVVGQPGSGKTTFLRALTRSLAQPFDPVMFPLYFVAQDFYRHDITSIKSLLDRLELKTGLAGLGSAAASLLDTQECVFIIDGLDELESNTATAIMRVVREFCATRPNLRYVASCRVHLLSKLVAPDLDAIIRLAPLDHRQIASFLDAWFEQKTDALQLLDVIACNDRVSELARRPLFLGMLAYSWAARRSTPISVAGLYESAVRTLLGRWDMERGVFRSNQHDPILKLEILTRLAVHVLRYQRHVLSTKEVLRVIRSFAEVRSMHPHDALTLAEEIESQSGLFARTGKEEWRFIHEGFVEYFCSRFVTERSIEEVSAAISKSGESANWIPAIVMAASALNATDAEALVSGLVQRIRRLGRAGDISAQVEQQRDLHASRYASGADLKPAK